MKMIKLFFLSMFLVPFAFSMDAKENISAIKQTIYDQLLNGINDNNELKIDVANILSFLLSNDFPGNVLDDEVLIDKII